MSAEVKPNLQLEIAHVLFMDVVGYSKLLIDDQREVQQQLSQIVRSTDQFRAAEADGKLVRLPSGDAMALVFFSNPEAPVQCALEISKALKSYPELPLRMGIHSGPVSSVADVNDRSSVAGAGINMAQRVMDCGDAGHILLSKRAADDLAEYRHWHPYLHDLGECEVKHGVMVSVVNLYTDELGNAQLPQKLKERTSFFGNFEILRDAAGNPLQLGRGTFGRTYQARHRYLETIVALKIISERFARDPTVRQRFLTEARAAAKLSHPHIARLYDFGEKDGVLFYAMEYCAGGDLADYVKKHGALSPSQLLEVATQLGDALQCAHSASLVHRDIKPSNVMLASGETALATKLIDFGLVHVHGPVAAAATDEAAIADSHLLGTPLFASPEQLREETVDARADLFSLGMTLWYLALGQSPETGSLSEITSSRLSAESYSARLPDRLPAQLKSALERLVQKDPANRFGTATEFLRAIGHKTKIADTSDVAATARVEDAKAAEPQVEPLALEAVNAPLASEWKTGSRHNETFTGTNYPAVSARDAKQQAWLHVLNGTLLNSVDLLWRLRLNAARFASLHLPGLLSPVAARGYSDFTAVVLEKPDCTPLLSAVPTQATVIVAELHPVLEKIAETCDAVAGAWLPGPNLQASDIWLQSPSTDLSSAQPKLFPRFLSARDAPDLSEAAGAGDVSSTITTEMFTSPDSADDMRAQFARLIYRLSAGRNCPAAASLASQAYVAVPNLSEQANRTLALVIARKREYATCRALLQDLRRSEGSSAVTSSYGARSRSTSASPPPATPPPLRTPFVAKPDATRTVSGTSMAPAVASIAFREPVAPARAAPRSKRSALIFAGVLLIGLIVAIAAYRSLNKPSVAPPKQMEAELFSPGTKLRLSGSEIPRHAIFSLAGKKLDPQPEGTDLVLGLEGIPHRFPLEVSVEAKGFKKTAITVKDDADLAASHPVTMFRSTGRILFVGPSSDYTHASASMKALLPDEKDLDKVRLERSERGTEIRPGGRNTIEIATGVYSVSLRSGNGHSVRPLFLPEKYEINADDTKQISVPATFVGRYKGSVKDSADSNKQFELEISIDSDLPIGELKEHRGSSTRHGAWTDGKVDSAGLYRAQVHFDDGEDAKGGDSLLTLRSIDEKKIALGTPDTTSSKQDDRAKTSPYPASGELARVEIGE
jgi:class 3 adenylate cyclase/tRNA A-37 threonylcarbamoyl transferase component Bud32